MKYWDALDRLVREHAIVIDRRKGSAHPRYPAVIYPLDYGFLAHTTTIDGGGIDIFVGSLSSNLIQGIVCTVDSLKNDAEVKIMYNCTEAEIATALEFLNNGCMSALFVARSEE
jgi:inorganic pyrophosphatase